MNLVKPLPPALAALVCLTSGCFSPAFPDGEIPCGEAGCPADMICAADGLCYYEDPDNPGGDPPDPSHADRRVTLAVGNDGSPNQVYAYCDGELVSIWRARNTFETMSVAWGDADGNGDYELAVANDDDFAQVYQLSGDTFASLWTAPNPTETNALAWAGGALAVSNSDVRNGRADPGTVEVYGYDGVSRGLTRVWQSSSTYVGRAVAWADVDGDGSLDLVVGARGEPNRVFAARGTDFVEIWSSSESEDTESVAFADIDGDGDPDLAVGNDGQPNRIYRNDGGQLTPWWRANESDRTRSIAFADIDGDGEPDLLTGNNGEPNRLYLNDGTGFSLKWSSPEADSTRSISLADIDGDGDPDMAVGNRGQPSRIYESEGGRFGPPRSLPGNESTNSIAWAVWSGGPSLCP
jgi:hypothetical protein